jgi:Tfp pilus assembly protein PilO
MKNLSKEKREKLILVVLVTGAILAGTWYGLINAQKKTLLDVAEQTMDQKTKVESARRLIASATDLQAKAAAAHERLRAIEHGMASGDMYSWVILTVNKFRADRKIDIPQFSREITTDVGVLPRFPYKAALFNLRGTAHFHDFCRFVADFENNFPFLRVQNIELEPASETSATQSNDPEKLAFKMELVALINPVNP